MRLLTISNNGTLLSSNVSIINSSPSFLFSAGVNSETVTLSLIASGVTAGTYNTVVVNSYGIITSGSNIGYLLLSGGTLTGGLVATAIDSTPIGATTPSTGAFTTLTSSGSLSAANLTLSGLLAISNHTVVPTGTTFATALQLTNQFSIAIGTTANGEGVILPPEFGVRYAVWNDGPYTLIVYSPAGATLATLNGGMTLEWFAYNSTTYNLLSVYNVLNNIAINNSTIGATGPNSGAFTTLSANVVTALAGESHFAEAGFTDPQTGVARDIKAGDLGIAFRGGLYGDTGTFATSLTVGGSLTVASSITVAGPITAPQYSLPTDGGNAQWVNFGTVSNFTQGDHIEVYIGTSDGYNSAIGQDYQVRIFFKASNASTINSYGFAGDCYYYSTGYGGAPASGGVMWVGNAAGIAATAYTLWVYLSPNSGRTFFTANYASPATFVPSTTLSSTTQSGTLNATITVTGLTSTASLVVGQIVSGTYIAANTTIATIVSTTSITLSVAATGSATEILTFYPLSPGAQSSTVLWATEQYTVISPTTMGSLVATAINSTPIGATTPSTGKFTSLTSTGLIVTTVNPIIYLTNTTDAATAGAYFEDTYDTLYTGNSVGGKPYTALLLSSGKFGTVNQTISAQVPVFRNVLDDGTGNATITGSFTAGSIDAAPIGASTPSTGAFTTLTTTGQTIFDTTENMAVFFNSTVPPIQPPQSYVLSTSVTAGSNTVVLTATPSLVAGMAMTNANVYGEAANSGEIISRITSISGATLTMDMALGAITAGATLWFASVEFISAKIGTCGNTLRLVDYIYSTGTLGGWYSTAVRQQLSVDGWSSSNGFLEYNTTSSIPLSLGNGLPGASKYGLQMASSGMTSFPNGMNASSGSFTNNLVVTGSLTAGAINATPIGVTTASTGVFTTLSSSDNILDDGNGNTTINGSLTVTGPATALTVVSSDNSTNIATTAFVKNQAYLTANQTITISGDATGSGTTAIALTLASIGTVGTFTKVVTNAKGLVTSGLALALADVTTALGYTPVNPAAAALTGGSINNVTIGATTASTGKFTTLTSTGATATGSLVATVINSTPIGASTPSTGAFTTLTASSTVSGAGFTTLLAPYAPLASAALTGTPTAPTAAYGTSTTQLATTAFVENMQGNSNPTLFITGATNTLTALETGTMIEATGSVAPAAAMVSAVGISGQIFNLFNNSTGVLSVTSQGGIFSGPGGSQASLLTVPVGATVSVKSDNTNWVTTGFAYSGNIGPWLQLSGGTLTGGLIGTTGSFTGAFSTGSLVATAINNTPIGATTPNTGAFTTLSASGVVSGVGFSNYLASPPAIGATTPSTGKFTTLTSTGATSTGSLTATAINSTPLGATTASTGAFTTLTSTGATSTGSLIATAINSTPIGATTPSTGGFTTLSATGAATITNATSSILTLKTTGTNAPSYVFTVNDAANTLVLSSTSGGSILTVSSAGIVTFNHSVSMANTFTNTGSSNLGVVTSTGITVSATNATVYISNLGDAGIAGAYLEDTFSTLYTGNSIGSKPYIALNLTTGKFGSVNQTTTQQAPTFRNILDDGIGNAIVSGTLTVGGPINSPQYSFQNDGNPQWVNFGTFSNFSQGDHIEIYVGSSSGFNSEIGQDYQLRIFFKTTFPGSLNSNGFAGDCYYYATGLDSGSYPIYGDVMWVANAAGASATSYALWIYLLGSSGSTFFTANYAMPGTFVPSSGLTSTSQTGTLNSTITVTGLTSTASLVVGQQVNAANYIVANTTIATIVSSTSLTLSAAATASTTETLTFLPLSPGTQSSTVLWATEQYPVLSPTVFYGTLSANGVFATTPVTVGSGVYANTGLTVGWNASGYTGEVDFLLGPQGGIGGLNMYQLNYSGSFASSTPIFALGSTGSLTLQGALTATELFVSAENATVYITNLGDAGVAGAYLEDTYYTLYIGNSVGSKPYIALQLTTGKFGSVNQTTTQQNPTFRNLLDDGTGNAVVSGTLTVGAISAATTAIQAPQVSQVQMNAFNFISTDTGTINAVAVSLTPAITSYYDGLEVTFYAASTNTGATTLNVNGLGAIGIRQNGSPLSGNEIGADRPTKVIYNSGYPAWFLIGGNGTVNVETAITATQAPQVSQVQNNAFNYSNNVTFSNNIFTAIYSPAITEYVDGMIVSFYAPNSNTGSTSFNAGAGALNVVGNFYNPLEGNEIVATTTVELTYSSHYGWWIITGGGYALQVAKAEYAYQAPQWQQTLSGTNYQLQNLVTTRAIGTTYTNSYGRPIFVSVTYVVESGTTGVMEFYVNGGAVSFQPGNTTNSNWNSISFIVSVGATYMVTSTNGLTAELIQWWE